MRRRSNYSQDFSSNYIHVNPDKNELFMLKKCLEFLQNHLKRYRYFNKETLEFLCWAIGPEREQIGELLLNQIQDEHREKFEAEISDPDLDLDDFGDLISRMFLKIKPRNAKRTYHRIMKLIGSVYSKIICSRKSEIEKNMTNLKNMFNLTDQEIEFCVFLFITYSYEAAETFFISHLESNKLVKQRYLANILGFSKKELNKVLNGTLKKISLFEMDNYDLRLEDEFIQLFHNTSDQSFSENYYFKLPQKRIPFDYYFIKKEERDHILNLLKEKPKTSTHILFYGLPGTGKTSFAYSLANYLKIPSYEIVRGDDNTTKNRRAAIVACQNITNGGNGSLVLVDEADNLLNTQASWFMRGETQDKGWLNELLEMPGVRMIWVTNSINGIEGSVLRRFAFSLHFKPFNRRQRIQLWDNILRKNKCKKLFSSKEIERFAKNYPVNAGIIDLAVKKSLEANLGSEAEFHQAVELALTAHETLVNYGEKKINKDQIDKQYSLEGLNVKGDLNATIKQLEAFDEYLRNDDHKSMLNMNLLYYGPPGTGKSELARYIANRLDRKIICKRISDLQSMYVGEGEKNIKRAFLEAENEEAILIIDEADSLLFSRDIAKHSWEISFTNEFLTQMERYRGILVCTTNRLDDLDAASFRRFNHKIGFDYLTAKGNLLFYELFLEPLSFDKLDTVSRKELKRVKFLAPGDFKVVRDRYSFHPKSDINHKLLIDALKNEAKHKTNHKQVKRIGFK